MKREVIEVRRNKTVKLVKAKVPNKYEMKHRGINLNLIEDEKTIGEN